MTKLAQQGCEYCNDGKKIKSWQGAHGFANVCSFSKVLNVEIPLDWGYSNSEFPIKYCPMCGKKLEAGAEK